MRAGIVVTGSELVRGDRTDLNGPFLARSLLGLGFDPAELRIVGDVREDIEAAIREGLRHDLLITSGGLGPTHDDLTVELLAIATGRELVVDSEVEATIEARSRAVATRMKRPYTDFAFGVRKQATLPEGAIVAGIAGTAPAVVLEVDGCVAVTLPGPPRELQELWAAVLETEPLRRLIAAAQRRERRALRFYGVGESTVAQALAAAGGEGEGVEVTICARDSEIHLDLFVTPGADARADALESALLEPVGLFLFSRTEEPIEALVLDACRRHGLHARHGRVVHRRARGRPPDRDRRCKRRVPRLDRLLLGRDQGVGVWRSCSHARGPRGGFRRDGRARWPVVSASDSAPRSRYR